MAAKKSLHKDNPVMVRFNDLDFADLKLAAEFEGERRREVMPEATLVHDLAVVGIRRLVRLARKTSAADRRVERRTA